MSPTDLASWQALTPDAARALMAAVTRATRNDHPDVMARTYDTAASLLMDGEDDVRYVRAARVARKRAIAHVARLATVTPFDWSDPAMAEALEDALHAQSGRLPSGDPDPSARHGWQRRDIVTMAAATLDPRTVARAQSWADADDAARRGRRARLDADATPWATALRSALAATGDADPLGAPHPHHTTAARLQDRRRYARTVDGTARGQAGTYDMSPAEAWQAAHPACRHAVAHESDDTAHRADCEGCTDCHTDPCGRAVEWSEWSADDYDADLMTGQRVIYRAADPARAASIGLPSGKPVPSRKRGSRGSTGPTIPVTNAPRH